MENIYFQPNKENSEFLVKLEKLDEYTIPQILERMVDHFRNLPELEDALNKLGIRTDSLKEELDDDIRVEERFWVGGKPKSLRHLKKNIIKETDKTPILSKRWYKNGQLKEYSYIDERGRKISKDYYFNGQISEHNIDWYGGDKNLDEGECNISIWYENGQLSHKKRGFEKKFYDKEENEISQIEWGESGYGNECNVTLRDNITGEYKD